MSKLSDTIQIWKHAGILYTMDKFLEAQFKALYVMFPLIAYGALCQFLGMVYDVELLTMAGHYCFGGVFGIAFGNFLRHPVAMKLFKQMEDEQK